MKASTSAGRTAAGGLSTTRKNTLRSYAAANTVFGRQRPCRNSRYSSTSGIPSRTTGSPNAPRDRIRHASTTDISAPPSPRTTSTTAGRNVHEDHRHNKQPRLGAPLQQQLAGDARQGAGRQRRRHELPVDRQDDVRAGALAQLTPRIEQQRLAGAA